MMEYLDQLLGLYQAHETLFDSLFFVLFGDVVLGAMPNRWIRYRSLILKVLKAAVVAIDEYEGHKAPRSGALVLALLLPLMGCGGCTGLHGDQVDLDPQGQPFAEALKPIFWKTAGYELAMLDPARAAGAQTLCVLLAESDAAARAKALENYLNPYQAALDSRPYYRDLLAEVMGGLGLALLDGLQVGPGTLVTDEAVIRQRLIWVCDGVAGAGKDLGAMAAK